MKTLLLYLVVLSVLVSKIKSSQDQCDKESCACRPWKYPSENDPTIIMTRAYGRLGNNLIAYALLYQLHISLGVETYVDDECLMYLRKVFTEDSIKLKSIEQEFCNWQDIKWTFYAEHMKRLLTDKSLRKGHAIFLFPRGKYKEKFTSYRPGEHESREHKLLNDAYFRSMRKTLKFKPEIMVKVNKIFVEVAKKMGKPVKDVTFVGVHNRRTDHLDFMMNNWNEEPLDVEYFYNAMEGFREDFDNVAFLYVSDDMEWGRENVEDHHGDLFFVGGGNPDIDQDIAVDLAVMANANHTIISRGTFSMWSAALCPGEHHNEHGTVVPIHILDPLYEDKELYL